MSYRAAQGIEERIHEEIRVCDHCLKVHIVLKRIKISIWRIRIMPFMCYCMLEDRESQQMLDHTPCILF